MRSILIAMMKSCREIVALPQPKLIFGRWPSASDEFNNLLNKGKRLPEIAKPEAPLDVVSFLR